MSLKSSARRYLADLLKTQHACPSYAEAAVSRAEELANKWMKPVGLAQVVADLRPLQDSGTASNDRFYLRWLSDGLIGGAGAKADRQAARLLGYRDYSNYTPADQTKDRAEGEIRISLLHVAVAEYFTRLEAKQKKPIKKTVKNKKKKRRVR